jgi:hypothetical protein
MAKTRSRQWADHVRRWRRSGLPARAYADQHGLNAATLYGWSSRLGREKAARPAHFIEVSAPIAAPRPVVVRVGAVEISVDAGFDAQLLRDVITALVAS